MTLFPELETEKSWKDETTIIGGIYTDNPDWQDKSTYYDGQYALTMGKNAFYFIFNGICDIEEIVELANKHNMILCKGYALAFNTMKKIWQIRDSGKKGMPDYIIAEGSYEDGFPESLRPLMKVFHK